MTAKEYQKEFKVSGIIRFALYMSGSVGLYLHGLEVPAFCFGIGGLLGFIDRLQRLWDKKSN